MTDFEKMFVKGSLAVSTVVMLMIFYGVSQRRKRDRHVKIMRTAGIVDIVLVLAIVAIRRALPKAMEADTTILRVHLAFSIPALLLWFSAFYTGSQRLKGKCITVHKWNAIVFLICRTGNYVTSFFLHPASSE